MFSCCRGKSYIGIWIGDMSSWTLSNLSRLHLLLLLLLLLLLFNCDCGCRMTDEHQQQNYTVTTKTQKTKRWIYIYIMCNFQLSRQITVRHIMLRCSYHRGIWWPAGALHKVIMTLGYGLFFGSGWHSVRPTPHRGIYQSWAVLYKVNLAFYRMQLRRQLRVRSTPQ